LDSAKQQALAPNARQPHSQLFSWILIQNPFISRTDDVCLHSFFNTLRILHVYTDGGLGFAHYLLIVAILFISCI
jgi:hypothetical protein